MASDILVSHIKLPHYSEKNGYNDHLFEDKILDIEEPQYENCQILRNILNKSLNRQNDKFNNNVPPKFEPRVTVGNNNLVSTKEKENIYENVDFINKYSDISVVGDSDSSSSQGKDDETLPKNCYRSTLSLIIGKPNNIDSQLLESKKSFNSVVKEGTNNLVTNVADEFETSVAIDHEESDDSSFKSSYAKSLMDSLHRTCYSPSPDLSRISSPTSNQDDGLKLVHVDSLNSNLFLTENRTVVKSNHIPKIIHTSLTPASTELKFPTYSLEFVEQLERKIGLLNDDICTRDKELEKLKQDLICLRLEFNHIKTENRSLKVSQNMNLRNFSSGLNGESQPSSLTSISACSDTWTLQQQVMSLNAQLEKAELSRHAYEAASRQLVYFLQTINSTLTTVAGKDLNSNQNDSMFLSPDTTNDILSQLQNTLTSKRHRPNKLDITRRSESPTVKPHWFNKNIEGSFISDSSIGPSYMNASMEHLDIQNVLPDQRSNCSSGRKYVKKERREKIHRSRTSPSNSKSKEEEAFDCHNVSKQETLSHQRTNSIPGRIFHSTKKSLVRSESVNNIPTGHVSYIPRVSRAMSTHCVNKVDISECKDQNTNSSSHRLVSARAKGFFTSLRSIFKNDQEKSQVESSGPSLRKKMTLPLKYRSSKAKYDMQVQNLLSVLPSYNNGTSNFQKKNTPDSIIDSNVSYVSEKSLQNSIFYVPCYPIDDATLEDSETDYTLDDNDNDTTVDNAEIDTSREELEVTQPTIPAKSVKSLNQRVENNSSCKNFNDLSKDSFSSDVELSGPQEISVTLSFHQDNTDNESGHSECSAVTGDGYCTSGSTRQLRDNTIASRTIKPGGGLNCFNSISNKLSPTKKNKAHLSPIRETFNNINNCKHTKNECGLNAKTRCSKKIVPFLDGTSISIRVSCGVDGTNNDRCNYVLKETCLKGTSNIACDKAEQTPVRRANKFNSKCLKQALWKLSRSSYRDPRCRIEFV